MRGLEDFFTEACVCDQPAIFEGLTGTLYFYKLLYKDELYADFAVQISEGKNIILHIEMYKFGPRVWKRAKQHFSEFMEWFHTTQYDMVMVVKDSVNYNEDRKWEKFICGLGFPEPQVFLYSHIKNKGV